MVVGSGSPTVYECGGLRDVSAGTRTRVLTLDRGAFSRLTPNVWVRPMRPVWPKSEPVYSWRGFSLLLGHRSLTDRCDELAKPDKPLRPKTKLRHRPDMAQGSNVDEARAPCGSEGLGPLESYAIIVTAGENH